MSMCSLINITLSVHIISTFPRIVIVMLPGLLLPICAILVSISKVKLRAEGDHFVMDASRQQN